MSLKSTRITALAIVAVAAGASLWARTQLPDAPIVTHFDASGHANGTMPRDAALAVMPALGLAIAGLMLWLLPAIMPKKATLARSAEACGAAALATLVFLGLIHGGLIALALHYPVDVARLTLIGVAMLFIVIGNYLPKTRYNYVMGIRNAWTLSSEEVWDRTHRVAGPLFIVTGLLIAADAILVPFPQAHVFMVAGAVIAVLICQIYAYWTAKKLNLT